VIRTELVKEDSGDDDDCLVSFLNEADSPTSCQVRIGTDANVFNQKMSERSWAERVSLEVRQDETPVTIGVCLLSHRNVILAMRETLREFLQTFCGSTTSVKSSFVSSRSSLSCRALVNILGNFSHQDVEADALQSILRPFIRRAVKPWLERPILSQQHEYEDMAGMHLLQSLPPIPLALTFVTALLEQKIVMASSRRSVLLSASTALSLMLRPLKWCHLIVPRVPSALASDLLQYPAPFILGLSSEDPEMTELIRDLPEDVTLVDLDVGRVILAPLFAHQSELGRGVQNSASTARELRSQVLYLAQCLGGVFGNITDPGLWSCDRPVDSLQNAIVTRNSPFSALRQVCRDFLRELVAGTESCCYWVEESGDGPSSEPTVLFDEDRFFLVKSVRHRYCFVPLFSASAAAEIQDDTPDKDRGTLALGLDDFDLIVEAFLRCQSLNAYIGSCDKERMAFY